MLPRGPWCTGDQPEPKAEPDNSSDENSVGERHPGTLREGIVTDGRGLFAALVDILREWRRPLRVSPQCAAP